MSDIAWPCHYRKNTPGYLNPWDQCRAEQLAMLVCSDPMYNKPLNIAFSGYTSGLPENLRAQSYIYAGGIGVFEVQITTGTPSPPKPCSGAFVHFILHQHHDAYYDDDQNIETPNVLSKNLLLDTGFYVDYNGYHSGSFDTPYWTGHSWLSGTVFASSGLYTGLYLFETEMIPVALPTLYASYNESTLEVTTYATHQDPYLPGWVYVDGSKDFGEFYWPLTSGYLTTQYQQTPTVVSGLDMSFLCLRSTFHPSGFTKGLFGTGTSGGHPPSPLSLGLRWYYAGPELTTKQPYLQINVNPLLSGLYYEFGPFVVDYKAVGGPVWIDVSYAANSLVIADGYYLIPLSNLGLPGVGEYTFRASGVHLVDANSATFYSPMISETFDLGAITLYAASSTAPGCYIDLWWEGPPIAEGYRVNYSGLENDDYPTEHKGYTDVSQDIFALRFDSATNCGREYSFWVCGQPDLTPCSDVVTAVGVNKLSTIFFSLYPKHILEGGLPQQPTTQYNVMVRWHYKDFDNYAKYVIGPRTSLPAGDDGTVKFTYSDLFGFDKGPFSLSETAPASMMYTLKYADSYPVSPTTVYGKETTQVLQLTRIPPTPTLTSVTQNGNEVTIEWDGFADEVFWESYYLHRTDGNPATIWNKKVYKNVTHIDTPPPGTWYYKVEIRAENGAWYDPFDPQDNMKYFAVRSAFSNTIGITVT